MLLTPISMFVFCLLHKNEYCISPFIYVIDSYLLFCFIIVMIVMIKMIEEIKVMIMMMIMTMVVVVVVVMMILMIMVVVQHYKTVKSQSL